MYQIVFTSRASESFTRDEIQRLCDRASRRNAAARVTGLFLYDGSRFASALEGERDMVDETFARIRADWRHHDVTVLSARDVAAREFETIAMSVPLYESPADRPGYIEQVKRAVAGLSDVNSRAFLIGFANLLR